MAALLVLTGPLAGERIEPDDVLSIGREGADVTIDDPEMSRRHATLRATAEGLELEDLGSLNGTLVNDQPISAPTLLHPGDIVELGQTRMEVQRGRAAPTVVRQVRPAVTPPAAADTDDRPSDEAAQVGSAVAATPPPAVAAPAAVAPRSFPPPPPSPDATPEPAPSPAGGGVGARAVGTPDGVVFTHVGRRYGLGYGLDVCGIWDQETANPTPVKVFPRTEEGWGQAWSTFVAWEPDARAVGAPAASAAVTPQASPAGSPPPAATPGAITPVAMFVPAAGYAGFWIRAVAALIDGVIINAIISPLTRSEMSSSSSVLLLLIALEVSAAWLYNALQESSARQATVGKRIMKIKVTDLAGRRLSFPHATGRYFAKILSVLTLGIGYAMAGFTERKQALHDIVAKTLVVRDG